MSLRKISRHELENLLVEFYGINPENAEKYKIIRVAKPKEGNQGNKVSKYERYQNNILSLYETLKTELRNIIRCGEINFQEAGNGEGRISINNIWDLFSKIVNINKIGNRSVVINWIWKQIPINCKNIFYYEVANITDTITPVATHSYEEMIVNIKNKFQENGYEGILNEEFVVPREITFLENPITQEKILRDYHNNSKTTINEFIWSNIKRIHLGMYQSISNSEVEEIVTSLMSMNSRLKNAYKPVKTKNQERVNEEKYNNMIKLIKHIFKKNGYDINIFKDIFTIPSRIEGLPELDRNKILTSFAKNNKDIITIFVLFNIVPQNIIDRKVKVHYSNKNISILRGKRLQESGNSQSLIRNLIEQARLANMSSRANILRRSLNEVNEVNEEKRHNQLLYGEELRKLREYVNELNNLYTRISEKNESLSRFLHGRNIDITQIVNDSFYSTVRDVVNRIIRDIKSNIKGTQLTNIQLKQFFGKNNIDLIKYIRSIIVDLNLFSNYTDIPQYVTVLDNHFPIPESEYQRAFNNLEKSGIVSNISNEITETTKIRNEFAEHKQNLNHYFARKSTLRARGERVLEKVQSKKNRLSINPNKAKILNNIINKKKNIQTIKKNIKELLEKYKISGSRFNKTMSKINLLNVGKINTFSNTIIMGPENGNQKVSNEMLRNIDRLKELLRQFKNIKSEINTLEEAAAGHGEGAAAGYNGEGAAGYNGEGAAEGYNGEGAAAGYNGEGAAGYNGEGAAAGYNGKGSAAGHGAYNRRLEGKKMPANSRNRRFNNYVPPNGEW